MNAVPGVQFLLYFDVVMADNPRSWARFEGCAGKRIESGR
jgi:hypothetical protein